MKSKVYDKLKFHERLLFMMQLKIIKNRKEAHEFPDYLIIISQFIYWVRSESKLFRKKKMIVEVIGFIIFYGLLLSSI